MLYFLLYWIISLFKKHPNGTEEPVAVRADRVRGLTMENNTAIGMQLLHATNSSEIKLFNNKVFPKPSEIKLVWRILIDLIMGILAIIFAKYFFHIG